MTRQAFLAVALLAGAAAFHLNPGAAPVLPLPLQPQPPAPAPAPPAKPKPKPKPPCPGPFCPSGAAGKPQLGGLASPDAKAFVVCDLPASEKRHNVGGRDGAGLCVFTSVEYCARFQNEFRLFNFQDDMRKEAGGGWPAKLDDMLKKYGRGVAYVQHTAGDLSFPKSVLATGRACGVTYGGYDVHYRGYVAHMVTLAYLDDEWAAITDNNFPGENELVWMSTDEFAKRWRAGGGGWAVALLSPPPPPKVQP